MYMHLKKKSKYIKTWVFLKLMTFKRNHSRVKRVRCVFSQQCEISGHCIAYWTLCEPEKTHRISPTTIVNPFMNWHFCLEVYLIYCRLLRQVSSTLIMQWFISHYLIQSSGSNDLIATEAQSGFHGCFGKRSFQMFCRFCVSWRRFVCLEIPCLAFGIRSHSAAVVFILKSSCWFNASQIEEMMNGFICLDLVPFKSLHWVIDKLLITLKSTQFGF